MDIKIGNNNKIKNSSIGHNAGTDNPGNTKVEEKSTFVQRHPVLISVIVSMITGFILLFSFWDNVIRWIENLFN